MRRAQLVARVFAIGIAFALCCGLVAIVSIGIEEWSSDRSDVARRMAPLMMGTVYMMILIFFPYIIWTSVDDKENKP